MNIFKNLAIVSALMLTCFIDAAPRKKASAAMPTMAIKSIKNDTEFDLIIIDRLSKNEITVLAGVTFDTSLVINKKNVIINGSMIDILAEKSQFIIRKSIAGIAEADTEVYLQLHASEGGVDNGSGIIIGMPGTIIFNFLMAGRQGGGTMSTKRFQNNACSTAEFDLHLFMNNGKIVGNGELIEK